MDTLLPLVVASVIFLAMGLRSFLRVRTVADFLPLARSGNAKVKSSRDFSASTVGTTVSLATIIAAYFGLANHFGLWLLWTAVTGATGMFLVYGFADRIAARLEEYAYKPSIHEFLATEYSNNWLKPVAAWLTVIGLLLLLATELLVGSSFLGDVIFASGERKWLLTVGISIVSVVYVLLGGFNTVIRTDRLQMVLIWIMIPILGVIILLSKNTIGGSPKVTETLPPAFKTIDAALVWFLVGIFLMNVPTHLSSMTLFQRISACESKEVLRNGLFRSSIGVLLSWSLLVVVAWLASSAGGSSGGAILQNVLAGVEMRPLKFMLMIGLYCAQLSTSSAFLIAIGHTFTTDVVSAHGGHEDRDSTSERSNALVLARTSIAVAAGLACAVVAVLKYYGFQVEDLIFSIYGGALALFPPILIALLCPRARLANLGRFALAAITAGFLTGWGIAFYGKIFQMQNAVFMSPAVGMFTSFATMGLGLLTARNRSTGQSSAISSPSLGSVGTENSGRSSCSK